MSKFKSLEEAVEQLSVLAKKQNELHDKYGDLEDRASELQDRRDDMVDTLYTKGEERIRKMTVVEEKKCKCCGTLLEKVTKSGKSIDDERKKLDKYVENHPEIKVLEDRVEQIEKEMDEIDDKLADISEDFYEAEDAVRNAFDELFDGTDIEVSISIYT